MNVVRCLEADREALSRIPIDPEELKDDGTDYTGKPVKKPWGYEVEKYRDENCAVCLLNISGNQTTSMHCHTNKTAMIIIAGGLATVHTLNEAHILKTGDMMVIEKGAFHRVATDNIGVTLYEIETPPNKRDLVRLEDAYGRGQGYEHVA